MAGRKGWSSEDWYKVDRNKFKSAGTFEKGNLLVVHGPSEVVPELLAR